MNLLMASVLLLAMLAFQPTLIYGTKNLASARTKGGSISATSSSSSNRNIRSPKYGKRHSTESLYTPSLSSAKLVMSMESGDVLVRSARGAATDLNPNLNTASGNTDGGSKRQNNKNKKLNKHLASPEGPGSATPSTSSQAGTPQRRKHSEKKFSAASGLSNNQQHKQQHSNGNSNSNNNKGNKQRQMLKSQNHQNKRAGSKANRENVEKTQSESEKISATCRYVKTAWSECDPKTNMRTRTLTLKKSGEPNCPTTRTLEKNCKKTCRYEKGAWSECTNGQMTREDKLKATGGTESSCEPMRSINKKCNPNNGGNSKQTSGGGGGGGKKERKNKEKGSRRVIKN